MVSMIQTPQTDMLRSNTSTLETDQNEEIIQNKNKFRSGSIISGV